MAFDKKNSSRSEIIQWRLELMIDMATALNQQTDKKHLASIDQYIRLGGEAYMAVSINDKSPLLGIGTKSKKLDTIRKHLSESSPKQLSEKDWNSKEERRVQAYLIKEALVADRNLRDILGLQDYFDELFFGLDEVSLGDNNHYPENPSQPKIVRCDLLAIGLKDGKHFPVLIELKYKRELTRLVEQLENFIKDIQDQKNPETSTLFLRLMKQSAGLDENTELETEFKKIIVWPISKKPQKSTSVILEEQEIIEVVYDSTSDYQDISKWNFHVN